MKLQILYEDLRTHAKKELELAGLFDKNSSYDGMLGTSVMEIIDVFSKQGHSGYSAAITKEILSKLLDYKTLTPNGHTEYTDVSESFGAPCLQDSRDPRWFSTDNGKSWYNVEDK